MKDFYSWDRKVLERFAAEAYAEVVALKKDLKDAIEAYRKLNSEKEAKK